MNRSFITVSLFFIAAPLLGQDGIPMENSGYYQNTVVSSTPFLRGKTPLSERIGLLGSPVVSSDCNSCCNPLLPTIAQGIRDTFNLLLPCRGVRRHHGQGLLFSARFYESGCCGAEMGSGEVIIESGGEPTPATMPPMPEEVTPEELGSAVQFRRLPANTATRSTFPVPTQVRPISGQVIIATESTPNVTVVPINPLRR